MKNLRPTLWLSLLLCLNAFAGTKKEQIMVSVFAEGDKSEGSTFSKAIHLEYANRDAFVSRMPDITQREIIAVVPFQAKDGSLGAYLRLSQHGRLTLDQLSQSRVGQSLVIFVNARQLVDIRIDKHVEDGVLPIPFGLTAGEVQELTALALRNIKDR